MFTKSPNQPCTVRTTSVTTTRILNLLVEPCGFEEVFSVIRHPSPFSLAMLALKTWPPPDRCASSRTFQSREQNTYLLLYCVEITQRKKAKTVEISTSEEATEKFTCIVPTIELLSNDDTFLLVLNSHSWKVDKVEPMGQTSDQILARIHCSLCNLERTFIVSNILESARNRRAVK